MRASAGPALARILPFAVYIAFLVAESAFGDTVDQRLLYGVQIATVAALLAWFWPDYTELRRPRGTRARHWLLAVGVGVAAFLLWIQLDFPWARIGSGRGVAGELARQASDGVLLRVLGTVLVVPVMEELFWRSFLMRWLERSDFRAVDPKSVGWRSILITAAVFAAEHHLWLAGLVAGIGYGWLYRRTGTLWAVVLAHAVTNAALEAWVHRTGAWDLV
jgi:hypothetical protein